MATKTLTAKLTKKASNGKGFVLEGQEGWFNANDKVEPFLAKIEVGKVVEVSYFQKGVKREVTLIKEVSDTVTEAPKEEGTYTNCAVCGKELKGKGVNYPNCWDCKDKAPKEEKAYVNRREKEEVEQPEKKKTYNNYDNPEKTAQIMRGNSLNAAGAAVSGNFAGSDPQTIAEATKIIAEQLLDWLRAE
jgi:hypothetical protein